MIVAPGTFSWPIRVTLLEAVPTPNEVDPVKQIAWELGGMAPALSSPPALLRAFRAMEEEESAYLDALDRILGPARAEALLNASGLGRSTASYTSR